jgi:hypothetical protein
MGLDGLDPVDMVGDGILGGVIGSNGHAIGGGLSSIKFEGLNDVSIKVVGDASDVFEFIGHSAEDRRQVCLQILLSSLSNLCIIESKNRIHFFDLVIRVN